MNDMLKVTSIEDLRGYELTSVVQLPDFAPGKPFVARLRKPSMLELVTSGQIPNALLATAVDLFQKNKSVEEEIRNDPAALTKFGGVLDAYVNASLVEPSLKDLKSLGIVLSDEQRMAIFAFATEEVNALVPFREKQANPKGAKHGKSVQRKTVSGDGTK